MTKGTEKGGGGGGGGGEDSLSAISSSRVYLSEYTLEDGIKEILRQTERHIEEQQRLSASADQRAISFAAVTIVVTGLLFEAGGAASRPKLLTVLLFLFSIGMAIYSAKPTRVFGSGGDWKSLQNQVGGRLEGYLPHNLIIRNNRNISHNDAVLKRSAFLFRFAMGLAGVGTGVLLFDWVSRGGN